MKKLVLAVVLVLAAGLCFAQEVVATQEVTETQAVADAQEVADQTVVAQVAAAKEPDEKMNMEVSVGVAIHGTKSPTPHEFPAGVGTDRIITTSTVVGFGMTFALHKFVGLTLDTDLTFGGELAGSSGLQSSSISLFGANVLFGPSFYLYKYRTFRIPMAVGVHMSYWDSTTWIPSLNATAAAPGSGWIRYNDLQVGLGLSVGIHFYFTHNAYMISRANIALDLFRMHQLRQSTGTGTSITDESHQELAVGWGVKPTIGLGLVF